MARKKLNDLSGKTKLISTKRLRKNSINVHIVNGVKYFIEDRSQIYLIFQPLIIKYFKASRMTVSIMVMVWKFKDMSNESVKPPATSDNSLRN